LRQRGTVAFATDLAAQRICRTLFNHVEGAARGGVSGWLKKRKMQLAFKPLLLGDDNWQDWTLNLPLTCCS
jgi:hypothetical protein